MNELEAGATGGKSVSRDGRNGGRIRRRRHLHGSWVYATNGLPNQSISANNRRATSAKSELYFHIRFRVTTPRHFRKPLAVKLQFYTSADSFTRA